MVVRLRVASSRSQMLSAKWIGARGAACLQVEGARAEAVAEAEVGEAWKSIDRLS